MLRSRQTGHSFFFTVIFGLITLVFAQSSCAARVDANKFSDFAVQIPQANTEIIAMNNIAGHLNSLLNNNALRQTVEQGAISKLPFSLDMDFAQDWLDDNRDSFPDTIVISGNDGIYASTMSIFQTLLRVNMALQAGFGAEFDEADLEELEEELAKGMTDLQIPDVTIWVHWPDKEMAEKLFEDFERLVAVVEDGTELRFESKDTTFRVTGSIADVVDKFVLRGYIANLGMKDSDHEIANALLDLEIFFEAEVVDGGIRVSMGEDPKGKPRSSSDDLKGIQDGPNELAYGRWNGAKMKEAANALDNNMERWAKTKLGKSFIATDSEDLWGTYKSMTQQMMIMPENGQLRVWAVENQVRANIRQVGLPTASTLVGSPILDLIPMESESFAISNHRSFGEFLNAWLVYFEDKMSTQSLKSDFAGDQQKTAMIDLVLEKYYENFRPMKKAIRDELAKIPSLPFGVVMDTKGNLESLTLDYESLERPLLFRSDRFFQLAAISKVEDTEAMQNALLKVYEKFVEGMLGVSDAKKPADLNLFDDIDLGSGIAGKELLIDWTKKSGIVNIEVEGNLRPHVFVKDGFVVFSTSVEFSKQIIESKSPLKIEGIGNDGSLVDYGRFRGVTFGNLYRSIFQFIGQSFGLGSQNGISDIATEFCAIMNHCDWKSTQNDAVRDTLYILDFKK